MFAYLLIGIIAGLSRAVSTFSPEGIRGLNCCYNVGEQISIVINSTLTSEDVYMRLIFDKFEDNPIDYNTFPDSVQDAPMSSGPYNITRVSLKPIQANVSAIFTSELDGSNITRMETGNIEETWSTTGKVSLTLCCKYIMCNIIYI